MGRAERRIAKILRPDWEKIMMYLHATLPEIGHTNPQLTVQRHETRPDELAYETMLLADTPFIVELTNNRLLLCQVVETKNIEQNGTEMSEGKEVVDIGEIQTDDPMEVAKLVAKMIARRRVDTVCERLISEEMGAEMLLRGAH